MVHSSAIDAAFEHFSALNQTSAGEPDSNADDAMALYPSELYSLRIVMKCMHRVDPPRQTRNSAASHWRGVEKEELWGGMGRVDAGIYPSPLRRPPRRPSAADCQQHGVAPARRHIARHGAQGRWGPYSAHSTFMRDWHMARGTAWRRHAVLGRQLAKPRLPRA
jgi:hypothetical protein